jgi:hypothetical protein
MDENRFTVFKDRVLRRIFGHVIHGRDKSCVQNAWKKSP